MWLGERVSVGEREISPEEVEVRGWEGGARLVRCSRWKIAWKRPRNSGVMTRSMAVNTMPTMLLVAFPLFHTGKKVEIVDEGEAEENAFEDEAAGEVDFDEVVGGEGGSGEGSDDDLDDHHDEEEDADRELRIYNSRALIEDVLGAVCITYAFDGVHGEIHHGRD